jgi:soluble P-type ATPase
MLRITIPDADDLALEHLICDVNGTLAEDGLLLEGIAGRLTQLASVLRIHLVTADTYHTLDKLMSELRMDAIAANRPTPLAVNVRSGAEKAAYARDLGATGVVAIGNGANDVALFETARLSIAVLGAEGTCPRAALSADVLCHSALDALDLLLYPQRLTATLRP